MYKQGIARNPIRKTSEDAMKIHVISVSWNGAFQEQISHVNGI
jgi:hypothetical protein